MELVEKLIEYVGIEVETPGAFSPIHIKSIISVITLTLILCIGFHSVCDLGYRCLMGLMSVVMISGELIKIVIPGLALVDGVYQFTFDWTSIPFQLCSTPLYVLPYRQAKGRGKEARKEVSSRAGTESTSNQR